MTNSSLAGKVALVTGAGNGIGRAIAETFAKAGAAVACVDLDAAQAAVVAQTIAQSGGRALALTCDVSRDEDVQKAADNIARLNPRPGQVFAAAPQNYVLPDVVVEKVDGEYQISFNNEQIPHLRISNLYKDIIASGNTQTSDVKDYIRDKIRSGKFLIRSIHQRQQTIMNIAQQIVSRQRDFLDDGPSHLKPMTMAEVAEAVGVHETTVSRAVSGKYMATPQGVFEMKYFFTGGYQTTTGESLSNTSVKQTILDLVKHESGSAPLSDHEIVEILSERGIPIARRTVAKYRSELNILPSHMRRKY